MFEETNREKGGSVNRRNTYDICGTAHLGGCTICPTKLGVDKLLAVLVEQIKNLQVGAARDFDQLGEAVAHLRLGQSSQKRKVEEGVYGSVVGA